MNTNNGLHDHMSALGNAVLAGWTAASGVALLDPGSRWTAPGVGAIAFILALFTSQRR